MSKSALVVIDVQNEYFSGRMPVSYPAGSLDNITAAMDAAGARELPVVVVQHTSTRPGGATFQAGSEAWQLHPAVAERPRDLLIEKHLPGSFTGTELEAWLRAHGVERIVIAGYMTQMCCDTTARQAAHMGLGVDFLSDATGTLDISNAAGAVAAPDLQHAILVTQAMLGSKVQTTADWLAGLDSDQG
jgi:nicotinamidase-related amidase